MICNFFKMVIIALCLGIFSMPAFAQYAERSSTDFMTDDGIFTDEEKDEEALWVKKQCDISASEQKYFDCACLAGAFRLKRNEEKLRPQTTIMNELFNDQKSPCLDPTKIAGRAYMECQQTIKIFRAREKDNEEYCTCVANSFTKDFVKKPNLRLRYIEHLKVNVMKKCDPRFNTQP